MDKDEIINALENEKNEKILYTNYANIKNEKNDILQRLQLERNQLKDIHKKLKYYKYIENPDELEFGHYIRWINLSNPENIKLTNGGIIIDMQVVNDMLYLTCKNNYNRVFRLNFNKCIVFQKLTNQENILLQIMDYLKK
jgi:hypothetical protein